MPVSQLTIYTSEDPGNGSDQPGLYSGQVGELIRILNKCLVTGYTGKAAAGWTHPVATASNIATYQQNGGAGMTMLVQDNGVTGGGALEATITGWEVCTAVSSPVGTGTGQFPTSGQSLSTGCLVARKSVSADSTGRKWICAADATTCYFWSASGDTVGTYHHWGFTDIFSFYGSGDLYRCLIFGATISNNGSVSDAFYHPGDLVNYNASGAASYPPLTTALGGHFMPRTWGGGGGSILATKLGEISTALGAPMNSRYSIAPMNGNLATPNGPDNSLYLSSVRIGETTGNIRGRMRGYWYLLHPSTSFADGQVFSGAGDFAGKTFRIIKLGLNGGYWAIETSNTVETN